MLFKFKKMNDYDEICQNFRKHQNMQLIRLTITLSN